MNDSALLDKILIVLGVGVALLVVFVVSGSKIPMLGKLPGDLLLRKDNITVFLPIASSIIISVVLTLILNVIFRK